MLAYRLQPGEGSPFAAPSGTVAWIALIAGIAGIWLVPGLWLSAVMMRTGAGPVARLATRIGTTLAWYALVGPVIHVSAQGALVTTGGIVGATVAATAAVCLGVALGLVRRPANPTLRILMAALAGGICAQTVIWLSMRLFTDGVNYEHIRRLDWLIVLACALLTAIGAHSRPDLPLVRTAGHIRTVLISLAVVAVTAVALLATGSRWSPAQRMPSAIGAEQVAAPPGADVAFALTAIGPEGPGLIQRAVFTASDDTGRPVPVSTRLVGDGTADPATLLVVLDPSEPAGAVRAHRWRLAEQGGRSSSPCATRPLACSSRLSSRPGGAPDERSPPAQSGPWVAGEQHRPSRHEPHHLRARLPVLDCVCTRCSPPARSAWRAR